MELTPRVIDAVRNGGPITVLGRVYAPAEEIERLRSIEARLCDALVDADGDLGVRWSVEDLQYFLDGPIR